MIQLPQHDTPATGWPGLVQNWRNDLIAAISVSLVAMPLALGIAVASGVPPMSGIFSAIVGGLVTTFIRGSHLGINGPTAGLIAVILAALTALDDGSGRALHYVLAAIVVSGGIQTLLGLFRLGRLAEIFPSSVIHGLLAAIGVIIIAKQTHVALGTTPDAGDTVGMLLDIFRKIPEINPFVAVISLCGILLLVFHARISYKLFHLFPAPMWVLVLALPFVYGFHFFETHDLFFLDKRYTVGPELLINIPDNPLDSLLHPDFSKIGTLNFWLTVLSITLIASVETLASTKAIDKLDPFRRRTDLNRDLIGVGLSTMLSGAIGGLPIITVIIRSTVNIHNNARTRWSNFFHGILLLLFVWLLAPVIQKVPLAALAVILVFSGFKLAAPRVFAHAYSQGMEQLLFMVGTLVITLYTNLLWGVVCGILLTLTIHILLARLPVPIFFQMMLKPGIRVVEKAANQFELKIKGIANFLSILQINKALEKIPAGASLRVNLSTARLVDLTVLESLEDFKRQHENTGGRVVIGGMEHHVASTSHRMALKSLLTPVPQRLSPRQRRLKRLAAEHGWTYRQEMDWDTSYLRNFRFFETRPIERKANVISGAYPDLQAEWEISDITFDEGALMATEVYNTTVQVLRLPKPVPKFVLEAEGFFDKIFDRVLAFSGQKDIDFQLFKQFSSQFLLKGEDEEAIRNLFTPGMIRFLESENIYHIESNGEALLIFRYLRLARVEEMQNMLAFSEELVKKIHP